MSPALASGFSSTGLPGKSTQLTNFILAILFCPENISNQECTLKLLFFSHLEKFLLWGVIQFELSPKLICFTAFFILWLTLKFWILWDCKESDTTEQLKHTHTHTHTHTLHNYAYYSHGSKVKSRYEVMFRVRLCCLSSSSQRTLFPLSHRCMHAQSPSCLTLWDLMEPTRLLCPWAKILDRVTCLPPWDLPNPGIEPIAPASADGFFTSKPLGSPIPIGNHF